MEPIPDYTCIYEFAKMPAELAALEYLPAAETSVKLGGRTIDVPRKQIAYSYANSYKFSGANLPCGEFPDWLTQLTERVNQAVLMETGCAEKFNYALINYYHDGSQYIGYHSDNEKGLKRVDTRDCAGTVIIASLSFGAARKFYFKHKRTKYVYKMELLDGQLLIMKGKTNSEWKHSVPKIADAGPRWNITWRHIE